jgi:hypothetical protein
MKKFAIILALAASSAVLSGCATTYPGPANYGTRAYAPADPNGWQVVSVTPVPVGTGATASDAGRVTSAPVTAYSQAPSTTIVTQPVYVPGPVYAPMPVYAPAPVYDPFWYPPVSIGLNFGWSNWGHGYRGGHHGYRGGYRGGRGHR